LEKAEGSLPHLLQVASQTGQPLKVDNDEDRVPRTTEEMEEEAMWLQEFFEEPPN
jgi:hypothetical protein